MVGLSTYRLAMKAGVSSFGKMTIRTNTTATTSYTGKPRMSAFRGGLVGFLLGSVVAGSCGYYFLINDYQIASGLLLNQVQELQTSTDKVRGYARQIEHVSADLKKLKESSAQIDQVQELRSELRKLYNSVGVDMLELKSQVNELEKDVHILVKSN